LPVLFVCENNQYATEVAFSYSAGNPHVAQRAAAYGLPGLEVDGNDVRAVYEAAAEAISRARAGRGATLLECKTYRTRAHAEGMGDFGYRTKDEVQEWKNRCPIKHLRHYLLETTTVGATELDAIEKEVAAQVEAAHVAAEASPMPGKETAAQHIFSAADNSSHDGNGKLDGNGSGNGAAKHDGHNGNGNGNGSDRVLTYAKATLEALTEEFAKNPKIFVLGEGIGKRGGNFATTLGLYETYGPERLCDTPICERGFVGLACGAAMSGTRPVVDFMFADFILDGAGEIINQIAKMQYMSSGRLKMPVLLRGCIGIGHSAATHHSGSYYSMYTHFPGLRVVVPSSPRDAKGLFKTALNCNDPVLFLEHRELMTVKGPVPAGEYFIDFGKASIVRTGQHVTVVALALMVHKTLKACDLLAQEGISVELIDPRTVAPLDTKTILESVSRTGRLMIVDEDFGPCGIGAEISAQLADVGFDELDAPIRRLNGVHTPTPYSPPLESAVVPDVQEIAAAIRNLVNE
jgi:2-oxoisovalerate dehydrogenase E1 component